MDALFPGPDLTYRAIKITRDRVRRHAADAAERRGAARPAARRPCTPAGTARPRSRPGGCWPGRAPDQLKPVTTSGQVRFRDGHRGEPGYKVFKVQALDANGKVLGTSKLIGT